MVKNTLKTDLGLIRVSDAAVSEIATLASLKVPGVAAMGTGSGVESLAQMLGVGATGQGVSVEMGSRELALRLFLVLDFGADIAEVCLQVQENVAEAVEQMTGLEVKAVDVTVQGVKSPGPAPAPGGGRVK